MFQSLTEEVKQSLALLAYQQRGQEGYTTAECKELVDQINNGSSGGNMWKQHEKQRPQHPQHLKDLLLRQKVLELDELERKKSEAHASKELQEDP